jgi:hypothetical protein
MTPAGAGSHPSSILADRAAGVASPKWTREGRWIDGQLLNERGRVIFAHKPVQAAQEARIAPQLTEASIKRLINALSDNAGLSSYEIPVFMESHL